MGRDKIASQAIYFISPSPSFRRHVSTVLGSVVHHFYASTAAFLNSGCPCESIVIIHTAAMEDSPASVIKLIRERCANMVIGIASDLPSVKELLELAPYTIRAYFNSYMAAVHYRHVVDTLSLGHQWFAPNLLTEMLDLARIGANARQRSDKELLNALTVREAQIARAIAEGLNNKSIASRYDITERTVKAHLTSIYDKLGVKDRLELARYILSE